MDDDDGDDDGDGDYHDVADGYLYHHDDHQVMEVTTLARLQGAGDTGSGISPS